MRYRLLILIIALSACTGKLSDEQRQKLHEQMDLHKIKKVTESEINEAAFARGREIMKTIENYGGDSVKIKSFIAEEKGKVRWLIPGSSNAIALEQQLLDAYMAAESGGMMDNVQKIRNAEGDSDSLLYTKPVVTKLPDKSDRLEGVWNIWLSKKELILSMKKK